MLTLMAALSGSIMMALRRDRQYQMLVGTDRVTPATILICGGGDGFEVMVGLVGNQT